MNRILQFTFYLVDTNSAGALEPANSVMDVMELLLVMVLFFLGVLLGEGVPPPSAVFGNLTTLRLELGDHLGTHSLSLFIWNLNY
jgi:hypothetical protein